MIMMVYSQNSVPPKHFCRQCKKFNLIKNSHQLVNCLHYDHPDQFFPFFVGDANTPSNVSWAQVSGTYSKLDRFSKSWIVELKSSNFSSTKFSNFSSNKFSVSANVWLKCWLNKTNSSTFDVALVHAWIEFVKKWVANCPN